MKNNHHKAYYKSTIIMTWRYMVKDKDIDQWNRIQSSEINPSIYVQLIFDKCVEAIQWVKGQSFQQKLLGKLDILMKIIKWDTSYHTQKINSNQSYAKIKRLKL